MEKNLSKNWYDSEIKGIMIIDGRKVIYLKSHVKRLWRFNDYLLEDKMDHINKTLIIKERIEIFYKRIIGQDEPLDN